MPKVSKEGIGREGTNTGTSREMSRPDILP